MPIKAGIGKRRVGRSLGASRWRKRLAPCRVPQTGEPPHPCTPASADRLVASVSTPSHQPGTFVISLDFELYWGVRDSRSLESYRENLLGVRTVVPRLLETFAQHGIRATWATVGFLFFDDKDELLSSLPQLRPNYVDPRQSPYSALASIGQNEAEDPFHFGWSLIQQIRDAADQEIASHTFSHYYCLERGQDAATFRDDLAAAVSAAKRRGITLESLVFPKNQVHPEYLPLCAEHGIKAYRGAQGSWLHSPRATRDESMSRRALRLADSYARLTGHNKHSLDLTSPLPRNVPASRFLRPYDPRLRRFDHLRVKRVCAEISRAADVGAAYHLWWHPHNFGSHQEANMAVLERILSHFAQLRQTHGMRSLTMRDAALPATP